MKDRHYLSHVCRVQALQSVCTCCQKTDLTSCCIFNVIAGVNFQSCATTHLEHFDFLPFCLLHDVGMNISGIAFIYPHVNVYFMLHDGRGTTIKFIWISIKL